ncbi:MAG: hypothetical protein P8009_02705 [Gammaproteobacteria bacterium]
MKMTRPPMLQAMLWAMSLLMAALALAGCSRPASRDDRALFVTAKDLRRVNCDTGDPDAGTFTKQHVPYMYDSIEYHLKAVDDSVACKVVIAATITVARDMNMAKGIYKGGARGAQIGLKMSEVTLDEAKEQFHYGDQSQYFNLVKHQRVVGFYYQARIGRVVYQYLVFGLRFSAAKTFASVFKPKLELARERYRVHT